MDNLPEEILLRIFGDESLEPGQNLPRLTLVNRKFDRIARPLLYSKCRFMLSPTAKPIRRFLSTLVTNQDTRSLVRCLNIALWQPLNEDTKDAKITAVSAAQLGEIVRSITTLTSFPLNHQQKFEAGLLDSSQDAMTAAILHLLPNLESLILTLCPCDDIDSGDRTDVLCLDLANTLTVKLIELSKTPSLAHLALFTHVSFLKVHDFCPDAGLFRWNSSLISVFLRLPALKTFVGIGCQDMDSDVAWVCEEGGSAVTEFQIACCHVGRETIGKILRSCRALEEFSCYRVCGDCLEAKDVFDYSYVDTHEDLYRHRDSLHTLALEGSACTHLNQRTEEPIMTFAGLNNLEILSVDEDALFGCYDEWAEDAPSLADRLPESLRRIIVYGERKPGQQHGAFRALRSLLLSRENPPTVGFNNAYIPDAEEMCEELSGVAIEEFGTRNRDCMCSFYMYRSESNQTEGVAGYQG